MTRHTSQVTHLEEGWQALLAGRAWHHVATLTLRNPTSRTELFRTFRHKFVRALARHAQGRVSWFAVVEGHDEREMLGNSHLHCLLGGTRDLAAAEIAGHWKLGYSRVTKFRGTPAVRYLTKTLAHNPDAWEMSRRLPVPSALGVR